MVFGKPRSSAVPVDVLSSSTGAPPPPPAWAKDVVAKQSAGNRGEASEAHWPGVQAVLHPGQAAWPTPQQVTEAHNWTEHRDDASGQAFYYNDVTGETSWTRPAALSRGLNALPTPPAPQGGEVGVAGIGVKFSERASSRAGGTSAGSAAEAHAAPKGSGRPEN